MAEERYGPLKPHPIVARLAEDPAAPREVAEFCGYVGKSTRADHVRLYTSLRLDEYIDIPAGAVVHHEEVPNTEMEHGGTRVWVEATAQVVHEVRQTNRTEARFLEGTIADEYLQDTMAEGQFEQPYTPYCRTNEPDCTANSCATCWRCPEEEANFGTPGPTLPTRCLRTCGPTCFVRTCAATCAPTCFRTCAATCNVTCRATCIRTCNTCGIVCTRFCTQRCPITPLCPRTQGCPATQVCPVTRICPVTRAVCPNTQICPLPTRACPSVLACPTGPVCAGPGPVEIPGPEPIDHGFGSQAGAGYPGYSPHQGWWGSWYGSGYDPWGR